jgi:hypothetical protein
VVEREDQDDVVAAQRLALERVEPRARHVVVLLGDDEVELAERERGQRLLGLHLVELDADVGMARAEQLERRRDEREQRRLQRRQAHAPAHRAGGVLQLGLGLLDARQQRVGVLDQAQPGVG